jgi:hypothetical protein
MTNNQHDALLIFSLLSYNTSTCFGRINSPSSGGRMYIWGGIQNIPKLCRHLYNSCGSAKHGSQQTKLWIPNSTATFCGDCLKTCEEVSPNFCEKKPGCFTMTTLRLTLSSSPSIWYGWGDPGRIAESAWYSDRNWFFRKRSKNGVDVGTGVYMRERTTSMMMAAGRPYGEFYDLYIVSPEYFGCILVCGRWYWLYCRVDCQLARAADNQVRSITTTVCHIYTFYLLMMGCWYARNM